MYEIPKVLDVHAAVISNTIIIPVHLTIRISFQRQVSDYSARRTSKLPMQGWIST
ncbi:hypothetical protein K435DRAFT_780364 [Dendrothele bispora CBS 962.96]|uniref:Uncharacterized protein n=1 Tax=Dendrothele bispora (strain CBS 962.96) TaxID=1314807 RepID=A0A4S8LRI7_DENBC|nr:hypothetical protein K435DRAFT_780364 [Dendrothele bispora CBS 962.96]